MLVILIEERHGGQGENPGRLDYLLQGNALVGGMGQVFKTRPEANRRNMGLMEEMGSIRAPRFSLDLRGLPDYFFYGPTEAFYRRGIRIDCVRVPPIMGDADIKGYALREVLP
jgi:hypothetical protein